MKWKVYKMILRPAVIGGLETVDLEVAELKMLKFSVTKTVRKEGKANISIQTLSFGPVCGFFSSVLCSATGLFPLNGSSSSPLFPLF